MRGATIVGTRLDGLYVNGSSLTWRGWVSWEGCFHQEGGFFPVADLGWGREEGGEGGIVCNTVPVFGEE